MRILIAEDERINQIYMTHLLKRHGHDVVVANDGTEAIARLHDGGCDLVLMDVQMPMMNGLEAARRIRLGDAGEDRRQIPIVALTAYSSESDRTGYGEAGITSTLTKPVDERRLLALIDDIAADA